MSEDSVSQSKRPQKTKAQKRVQAAIPETRAEHSGEPKIPVEDGASFPLENKNDAEWIIFFSWINHLSLNDLDAFIALELCTLTVKWYWEKLIADARQTSDYRKPFSTAPTVLEELALTLDKGRVIQIH